MWVPNALDLPRSSRRWPGWHGHGHGHCPPSTAMRVAGQSAATASPLPVLGVAAREAALRVPCGLFALAFTAAFAHPNSRPFSTAPRPLSRHLDHVIHICCIWMHAGASCGWANNNDSMNSQNTLLITSSHGLSTFHTMGRGEIDTFTTDTKHSPWL